MGGNKQALADAPLGGELNWLKRNRGRWKLLNIASLLGCYLVLFTGASDDEDETTLMMSMGMVRMIVHQSWLCLFKSNNRHSSLSPLSLLSAYSPVFPPFIRIIIIGAKDNLTTDTVRLRKVPWWYVHDSFRNKNQIKQSLYFSSLSPCMRLVITRIYEFPSDPFAFLWHVPLPCSYTMSGIMVLMAVSIK